MNIRRCITYSVRASFTAVALLAGCSLATSFDGLTGERRPASGTTDASTDSVEIAIDARQATDAEPDVDAADEGSEDLDASADGSDATWESFDASQENLEASRESSDAPKDTDACTPDRCAPASCFPCQTGEPCLVASDCLSKVCSAPPQAAIDATFADAESGPYTTCQAPSCTDRVLNGNETDVDCGGWCPQCPSGATCRSWVDCQSKVCTAGRCAIPKCNDGVMNGSETAVDCGGGCPGCPPGQGCVIANDCSSGVCKAKMCEPPTCADGVKNGAESDVDCGGGTCPTCPSGRSCNGGTDCTSGVCRGGSCRG
jgi:hypothetical protein